MNEKDDQPTIRDVNEELMARVSDTSRETDGQKSKEKSPTAKTPTTEHTVPEEMLVESEVEPSTIATNPQPQADPASTKAPKESARPFHHTSPRDEKKSANQKRTATIIVAALLLIITATVALTMLFSGGKETDNTTQSVTRPKLGITVTKVEGTVEYVRGEGSWQPLDTSTKLEEDDTIRLFPDSRAVLTLEDGTVKELEPSMVIRIISLEAGDVRIEQIEA